MMSKQARDLLMQGDQEGLKAYKGRMYRKMGADSPDKVLSTLVNEGWWCLLCHFNKYDFIVVQSIFCVHISILTFA